MKRTPLARHTQLQRATPTPGTVRAAFPARGAQSGHRPRAERIAGQKPAGNPIPAQVRAAIRERSGGRCEINAPGCSQRAVEQHHRKRRRDGGHGLENLLDACSDCHRHAHRYPAVARDRGWIVSAFEVDPGSVPLRGDDHLTWLHGDGTKTTQLDSSAWENR